MKLDISLADAVATRAEVRASWIRLGQHFLDRHAEDNNGKEDSKSHRQLPTNVAHWHEVPLRADAEMRPRGMTSCRTAQALKQGAEVIGMILLMI